MNLMIFNMKGLFSLYDWNVIINPQKLPAHTPSKHSLVWSSFSEQCFKSKVVIALGWKFRVRFLSPFPHVLLHELQDDQGVSISAHDAVMPPKIYISINLYQYSISIYLLILSIFEVKLRKKISYVRWVGTFLPHCHNHLPFFCKQNLVHNCFV